MQNMTTSQIIILIAIIWTTVYCKGVRTKEVKDCEVYYVNSEKLKNVSYTKPTTEPMQIGFLHRNHDHQDEEIQIFVYIPGSLSRYLLIYIKSWERISILNTEQDSIATSEFDFTNHRHDSLFWNYVIISITADDEDNSLISVLRPGDVTPIISAVKDIGVRDHTRFRYLVVTKDASYLTFNCLSKCPFFADEKPSHEELFIPNRNSFFIDVMPTDIKTKPNAKLALKSPPMLRKFEYKLDFLFENYNDSFKQMHIITASKECKLRCNIIKTENITEIKTIWNENIEHEISNGPLLNVTFTILQNDYNIWTYNCNPPRRKKFSARNNRIKANSVGMRRSSAVVSNRATKETFGVGEIIAWVIATMSISGLSVMGVMLYRKRKLSQENEITEVAGGVIPQIKIDSVEQNSTRNSFKKFKESFRRKPSEESSEPGNSEADPNMLNADDQFYPLQIITDDEASENDFSSLTTYSNVHNSKQ